ncbi:hypothetical protein TIFTF001_009234 [Ficus carica]|uniref:Uncharacterized protein n=1 Tax=Ficus carica TaxID=3494 RepID=A0AA87ZMS3_FICCA|nr:hypothetical protein TIFTF001_009234 [Ficus carica]
MINGYRPLLGPADGLIAAVGREGDAGAESDLAGLTVGTVEAVSSGESRKPLVEVEEVCEERPYLVYFCFFFLALLRLSLPTSP